MIKQLIRFLLLSFGVVSFAFILIRLIPGDPIDMMYGDLAPEDFKNEMRESLHLTGPILEQYKNFITQIIQFDLGQSIKFQSSNANIILQRLPATFELGILSMGICVLFSLFFGIIAARKQNHFIDKFFMSSSLLGMSVPNFWLGPMLVLVFSIYLGWFPVSERGGILSYVLPVCTLSAALSGILFRVVRASILEIFSKDYIRTAFAKGAPESKILYFHVLRNALIPIVTIISLQFAAVMTGTIVTEIIFDWPGLGSLTYEAIKSRDFPLVQACIITIGVIIQFVNLLTDRVYVLVNPKLG